MARRCGSLAARLLRAELIERGYDATGFVTLEDAVARLMLRPGRRLALLVLGSARPGRGPAVNATLPDRDQELTPARQRSA
jgi:hypothetical protein